MTASKTTTTKKATSKTTKTKPASKPTKKSATFTLTALDRLHTRASRLVWMRKAKAPSVIIENEKRMVLQAAVALVFEEAL